MYNFSQCFSCQGTQQLSSRSGLKTPLLFPKKCKPKITYHSGEGILQLISWWAFFLLGAQPCLIWRNNRNLNICFLHVLNNSLKEGFGDIGECKAGHEPAMWLKLPALENRVSYPVFVSCLTWWGRDLIWVSNKYLLAVVFVIKVIKDTRLKDINT